MPWVKSLLSGVFGLEQVVNSGSLRFIVIDGSTVQEPGATETTYRLHIAIDLINLSLRQVEVTTDKTGENLDHYQLESGDVVLIDRGYNQPNTLIPFLDRGGEVVLRYNAHSMTLYEADADDPAGQRMIKVDWESRLQTLKKQPGCFPVYLCSGNQRIQVFVHAIPLPPEQAEQARRQAKKRAQKKGRAASDKALYLSEWVLVLTSLPPELLDTETASALYRVRWQVELLIKRLKSLLQVDELRARKGSQLAELYLHGKLLYAAVTEKIMQRRFPTACRKMDAPRQLTDWRLWQTVADDLKAGIKGCFPPSVRFTEDCLKSLAERRRKRSLQALPAKVTGWITTCRERGVSLV
ncbi:MAG: transposase [Thiolinea sp.]